MGVGGDLQDKHYKLLAMILMATATLIALLYGQSVATSGHRLGAAMAALLVSAAPFSLGGFLGFLFGIPKTLQLAEAPPANGSAPNGAGSVATARRHGWEANTNLEQVSDWLTKILIGVGLTQLQRIPAEVQATGEYFAAAFGADASSAIVTAMLVSFSVGGFVTAYLLTKFDLGRAIDREEGVLDALASAIVKNPNDRQAVESFMLSSLYLQPPDGFQTAIQAGENFLNQEGHPDPEKDTNVFAYLACAFGQQYAWQKASKATKDALDRSRASVLENVKLAVRDPGWVTRFRQLMMPPVGSKDDDLAELKDDPDLKAILGITN